MSEIGTDLVPSGTLNALTVFSPGGVNDILERITKRAKSMPIDISTVDGRKSVASLAYKIARSKTALDKLGKDLTDEWRVRTDAVNSERRTIRERLDALADEIRKPLTDWENAEKERVAAHERAISDIREAPGFYDMSNTVADLARRLEYLRSYPSRNWQEFSKRAADTLAHEMELCETALARAEKYEADQAESARLAAEEAELQRQETARLQAEREARIAEEAAELAKAKAEAKAAQEAIEAAQAATRERQAIEQREAQALEQARKAEVAKIAAEKKAADDAAKAKADMIAAIEAERRRIENDRLAEIEAAQKRAANIAHKAKINRTILATLTKFGMNDDQGKAVIAAIARGEVPHVSINY